MSKLSSGRGIPSVSTPSPEPFGFGSISSTGGGSMASSGGDFLRDGTLVIVFNSFDCEARPIRAFFFQRNATISAAYSAAHLAQQCIVGAPSELTKCQPWFRNSVSTLSLLRPTNHLVASVHPSQETAVVTVIVMTAPW